MEGGSSHPTVDPSSFSFRVSCYESFGWTPDDVARLPYGEACLLSIYFEETAAYQHKKQREAESQQASSASDGYQVVDMHSDDDPQEAVYADFYEED